MGSSNNYAYLVRDDKSNDAVIIDPANPPEYVSLDEKIVTCADLTFQGNTGVEDRH